MASVNYNEKASPILKKRREYGLPLQALWDHLKVKRNRDYVRVIRQRTEKCEHEYSF